MLAQCTYIGSFQIVVQYKFVFTPNSSSLRHCAISSAIDYKAASTAPQRLSR